MALPTILSLKELTVLKSRSSFGATRKAQRIWRIVFAERLTSHEQIDEVRTHNAFPARGAAFKSGDLRVCDEVTVVGTDETGSEYLVYADYTTNTFGGTTPTEDPLERKDEISGDYTTESKPYFIDSLGAKVLDTAGFPVNPLPTRLAGIFRFNVTGNRAISGTRASEFARYLYPSCSYNHQPVTIRGRGFAANVLLVMGLTFTVETENDVTFERWNWTLGVNPDGWDEEQFESRGFFAVPFFGGDVGLIYRGNPPTPVSEPWPLDADGEAVADPTTSGAMLARYPYYPRDFSAFGFTQSL